MKHKLRINLLASWGEHGVSMLIGLFLMPFVLNVIGDEQYGLWLFICSIAGYSGLLNLGFAQTISRFVAHHQAKDEVDEINSVVSVVGLIYLGIGAVVMLVSGALAYLIPYFTTLEGTSVGELRFVAMTLGANVALTILGSVFGGVIVGLQRMDVERGIRTICGVVRLVLTVFFLKVEYALSTLALIFFATTLVENVGYAVIVKRLIPTLKLRWRFCNQKTLKACSGFSAFSLLENISVKLVDATDTIVIGAFFGMGYIVPYYVALRLSQFITQPLQLIGAIVMPRGAELAAEDNSHRIGQLLEKGLGVAFLLTTAFFIGASYFGDSVLRAWVSRDYPESHMLLLVLLGAQVIATPIRVLRGVLFGLGHLRVPGILYFAEAIANLVLSLILVKPLGLLGVALGTAIPIVLLEVFVLLPYSLKLLKLPLWPTLSRIVSPHLPPLFVLWTYSAMVSLLIDPIEGWLSVVGVSAGGGAVLGTSWLVCQHANRRMILVPDRAT